jgi:hypothetical protein
VSFAAAARAARVAAGAALAATALSLVAARPAAAQSGPRDFARAASAAPADAASIPLLQRRWVRPVASLLVPGSGQLLGGQARGLLYLAAEVWVVSRAVAAHGRGSSEAAAFRSLAFRVARRQFTTQPLDGPWDYYEAMANWPESGAFDSDPGPGFAPERDSTTYNGHLWRLAEQTFFANPDSAPASDSPAFLAAMAFYRSHAVSDPYRWSWRNARLEQDVYRSTIRSSDAAYQQATNWLGALVLNHLSSAIDAFITFRLGRRPPAVPHLEVGPASEELRLTWRAPIRLTR